VVEKYLSILLKQPIEIVGSSRTDAGVHVKQQFAHFDFEQPFDPIDITYRLNSMLPPAMSIKEILLKSDDFHSRFEAKSRSYLYQISTRKNPFLTQQAYHFATYLDINQMNKACEILLQHTDYQAFSKVNTDVATFNCTIFYAHWIVQEDLIVFNIKANRFLRGMVRAIVGTLMQVGLGKISVEQFEAIIISKNRKNAGVSVPAKGLFLVAVEY
jgi:tRNA pseudouridine38-40 synthase